MNNKVKKVAVLIEQGWLDLFNFSADKNLVPDVNTTIEQCVNDLCVLQVQRIKDIRHSCDFRPIPADIFTDAIKHPRSEKALVSVTIKQHYKHKDIVEYLDSRAGMELADYVNTAIKLIALKFFDNSIPLEAFAVHHDYTNEDKLEAESIVDSLFFLANTLNQKKAKRIKELSESSMNYKRPIELTKNMQSKLDLVVEAGEVDLFKDTMNSGLSEQIVDTIFNAYDENEYLALLKIPIVLYLDVREVEGDNNIYLFVIDSNVNEKFASGMNMYSKLSVDTLIQHIIKTSLDFTIELMEEKATATVKSEPIDMGTLQRMLQYVIATALRIERGPATN